MTGIELLQNGWSVCGWCLAGLLILAFIEALVDLLKRLWDWYALN